jgi:hypothetical protein
MMNFIDLMAVIGMFLLRVGVPVAITAGVVYLLKRLDRRWEMEARAARKAGKVVEQPAGLPATPSKRAPSPELPFVPPPATPDRRIQPGVAAAQVAQPGLSAKGSRPAKAQCDAPQNPGKPCWQARFDAEGKIPEECVGCDIFQHYPVM